MAAQDLRHLIADPVARIERGHRILEDHRDLASAVAVELAGLQPRAISYVACDPAALARDTAALAEAGYRLTDLRAFDLFPMTAHVECVALFQPA